MSDKRKEKGEMTRNRIIDTAAQLMQKQGYVATSLNQLIAISEQPKGSIYFHFPGGKKEIAVAAATKNADEISMLIEHVFDGNRTLIEAVGLICDEFSKRLKQSNYEDGCPMASLTTSAIEDSDKLHQVCGQAYENWLLTIEENIKNSTNVSVDEATSLSSLILSAIEGAILLSQGRRNTKALDLLPLSLKRLI